MPTGQFGIYNNCLRTFFSVEAKIYLIEFYKQDFASEVLRFNKFSHIFTFPFVQPPKSIMKHVQKDIKNCQSLTAMPGGKVSGAHFYLSFRVEEVTRNANILLCNQVITVI